LNDPSNADFLRSLATGQTPRELVADADGAPPGNVTIGLIDKREEDYVEQFRSFSGQGASLGVTRTGDDNSFDPATMGDAAPVDDAKPTTSISVRLLNGQRQVIRINLDSTVADLASLVRAGANDAGFRLVSGYPPKPLIDGSATIEAAGLKGAQVMMQKS
jgi:UBX domain-containing protein 1